jgi:hypothetical protein
MYKDLKTLRPGGIRTRDLLFWRRTGRQLHLIFWRDTYFRRKFIQKSLFTESTATSCKKNYKDVFNKNGIFAENCLKSPKMVH